MKPDYIYDANSFSRIVQLGHTRESEILEFKAMYEPAKHRTELRKDVASFVNTWGGTLVIGVTEGPGAGYNAAKDLRAVNQEEMLKWVTSTLGSGVFPRPEVDVVPLTVKKLDGSDAPIVCVNIRPTTNALGCYETEDGSLRFPRRDTYGVKYLTPEEISEAMSSSNSRRIYVVLNELSSANMAVHIASPIVNERIETNEEWKARLLVEHPSATWNGSNIPSPYRHRTLENRTSSEGVTFITHNQRQMRLKMQGEIFLDVPLGLVREAWVSDDNKLHFVFDCEVVYSTVSQPSVFLRTG